MKNKKTNIFEIFEKKKNLEKKQKNFYFIETQQKSMGNCI